VADAINYKDYSVIVITKEERQALSDVLDEYVEIMEGSSVLNDLASLIYLWVDHYPSESE